MDKVTQEKYQEEFAGLSEKMIKDLVTNIFSGQVLRAMRQRVAEGEYFSVENAERVRYIVEKMRARAQDSGSNFLSKLSDQYLSLLKEMSRLRNKAIEDGAVQMRMDEKEITDKVIEPENVIPAVSDERVKEVLKDAPDDGVPSLIDTDPEKTMRLTRSVMVDMAALLGEAPQSIHDLPTGPVTKK